MITVLITIISLLLGLFLGLNVFLAKDIFYPTTSAPTSFEYLLFGFLSALLILLPLIGAFLGYLFGQHVSNNNLSVIQLLTDYRIILLIILTTLAAGTYTHLSVHSKAGMSSVNHSKALIIKLTNTKWNRVITTDESIEELATNQPRQIMTLQLNTNDLSMNCLNNQVFTAEYSDGTSSTNCWHVTEGKQLFLYQESMTDIYSEVEVTEQTLEFKSAGQTWNFAKNESSSTK